MNLREVKEWVNSLPEEFLDYNVANGEEKKMNDGYYYRIDKPIISLMVDEDHDEVLFLSEAIEKADYENSSS